MPINTFIAQVNVIEDLTHYARRSTCACANRRPSISAGPIHIDRRTAPAHRPVGHANLFLRLFTQPADVRPLAVQSGSRRSRLTLSLRFLEKRLAEANQSVSTAQTSHVILNPDFLR
jgi:hypothetical protein